MRERLRALLCLITLCLVAILIGGCLGTTGVQTDVNNTTDTQKSGTPPPTTPVPIITPNASNVQGSSVTYPPHHPPTIFIFSLPNAIGVIGEPVFIPMKLPEGYAYGTGSANTEGVVSLGISNGSNGILYLQVSPSRPIPGTLSGSTTFVNFNRITGTCTMNGSQHQLSWSDGSRDFYLSGTLPCEEYVRMAASLELLTPDSLGRVPWNELKPAVPLPPSQILNLVFSREWLDAHDTNPDPQIINVTMTADEFNSSFFPDPEDPGLLRQVDVKDDRPVALLNMPKNMFAGFNDDLSKVKINFPESFFRFYPTMDALHDDLASRRAGSSPPGVPPGAETPIRTLPSVPLTTTRIS
jgi:hypothetical protein